MVWSWWNHLNSMPGPGTKGGGGSRHKYKKEPGVDNSDDDESLDTLCDEVGMKSKSCSASDSPQVKVSSPLSSASPSPSKKPHGPQKIQSQTKEREPTICLGGELASYDEVKVKAIFIFDTSTAHPLIILWKANIHQYYLSFWEKLYEIKWPSNGSRLISKSSIQKW